MEFSKEVKEALDKLAEAIIIARFYGMQK